MAQKIIDIPEIGSVTLVKRRGSRNIRLGFGRDGSIRVSLPYWLPYQSGVSFVRQKQDWIKQHRPAQTSGFTTGSRIGKAHRIEFVTSPAGKRQVAAARIVQNKIVVSLPTGTSEFDKVAQKAAERGALRALKREADQLLPRRLHELAAKHRFAYKSVTTKRMTSRWGSCSQAKDITLNVYLMQLPWQLIDYVIVHELVHTEHLNHSAAFWDRFEHALPGAKKIRKELKVHQTVITPTSAG